MDRYSSMGWHLGRGWFSGRALFPLRGLLATRKRRDNELKSNRR